MGEVADVFETEFRAFALDGVPGSGAAPASVANARAIGAFLEALMKSRLLSDLPGGPGSPAGKRQWGVRVNATEDGFEYFDRGLALCNCYSAADLSPKALSFALDCSSSMTGGRLDSMKLAMIDLLEVLRDLAILGVQFRLQLIAFGYLHDELSWNDGTIWSEPIVTPEQLDAAMAWVGALTANKADTDWYLQAAAPAVSWFKFRVPPAVTSRHHFMITDGLPSQFLSPATPQEIVDAALGDVLGWGDPGVLDVNRYVANVDLEDVTYSAQYDNSSADGVPIISGDDSDALRAAVLGALFDSV